MEQHIVRLAARVEQFVDTITAGMTKPQRHRFAEYALGLLVPGDRKSMEPLAARIDPEQPMARYKTFQRFISVSEWDDRTVRRAALRWAMPAVLGGEAPLGWIIDETGYPKKGTHSVFVHRQYSGTLGKVANCQVAVSLSVATAQQSLPIDFELYMPEVWADDPARRATCKVPAELEFRTKPEIALELIEAALRDEVPVAPVLADSLYGDNGSFRSTLDLLGLDYVVGVHAPTTVVRPDKVRGKKRTIGVRELALAVGREQFQPVCWREGTKGEMKSCFYAIRVELPRDDGAIFRNGRKLWLLIEWPEGEAQPTKFWLATLPRRTSLRRLVFLAKARWIIERDYQDLKGEVGLDHFEGRSYVGWHHHLSMCLAAYAFLITERAGSFPPSAVPSEGFEALAPPTPHVRRRGCAAAA